MKRLIKFFEISTIILNVNSNLITLMEKFSGEVGNGVSMVLLLAGLPVLTEERAKDRLSAALELFLLCQASAI